MVLYPGGTGGGTKEIESASFQTINGRKHITFSKPHKDPIALLVHVNTSDFSIQNAAYLKMGENVAYNFNFTTLKIENVTSTGFDIVWDAAWNAYYCVV